MNCYNASSAQAQWLGFEVSGAGKLGRSSEQQREIGNWCSVTMPEKGAEERTVDGKL
jgi:glycine cleavage system H lipoate-binding protein